MSEAPPLPGLRCVIAWSDRRNLCSIISDDLRAMTGDADIRRLSDDAVLVHTTFGADELRNQLRSHLTEEEGLLVIDFEVWSGYGKALDAVWLLARGH